jgi:hypothetical protein
VKLDTKPKPEEAIKKILPLFNPYRRSDPEYQATYMRYRRAWDKLPPREKMVLEREAEQFLRKIRIRVL